MTPTVNIFEIHHSTWMEIVDIRKRIEYFLNSRKTEDTRRYSDYIIKTLSGRRGAKMQSSTLQKILVRADLIPNNRIFFRLLKDLVENDIIKKEEIITKSTRTPEREKPDIYYYIPYPESIKLVVDYDTLVKRYAELDIAKELLKEYGCEDPEADIEKRFHEIYGSTVEEFEGDD